MSPECRALCRGWQVMKETNTIERVFLMLEGCISWFEWMSFPTYVCDEVGRPSKTVGCVSSGVGMCKIGITCEVSGSSEFDGHVLRGSSESFQILLSFSLQHTDVIFKPSRAFGEKLELIPYLLHYCLFLFCEIVSLKLTPTKSPQRLFL